MKIINFPNEEETGKWTNESVQAYFTMQIAHQLEKIANTLEAMKRFYTWQEESREEAEKID